MFATDTEEEQPAPEPPAGVEDALSAIFAADTEEEQPAPEPSAEVEASVSADDGPSGEEAPEPASGEETPPEAEKADEPAAAEEEPAKVEEAPVPAEKPEPPAAARYTAHPVENAEIPVMHLHSGSVSVRPAFLVAMDEGVEAVVDEEGVTHLTGTGTVLLGQGYESPVRFGYTPGMAARYDMLAIRPDGVGHESMGFGSIPSLARLHGDARGDLLFFCSGRTRAVRLHCGVRIRAETLVAADHDVRIEELPEGWLRVSGEGRVLLSS
jgi:hypothetical protein